MRLPPPHSKPRGSPTRVLRMLHLFNFCFRLKMPRNYTKKLGPTRKQLYNPIYLKRAVEAVKRGMAIRRAAENFGVPYTTVYDNVRAPSERNIGGQPVLSTVEERKLADALLVCADWGFPFKSYDVRHMVQQYLNKAGRTEKRFEDNFPGVDWFKSFMGRHEDLTIKLAENTKRVRAAVTYEVVQKYFTELATTIGGVPSSNIINYDETNFCDDPGQALVVVRKGKKHSHRVIDTSKTSTSVMFAVAGDGTLLPPYIVYKSKHMYQGWTEGGFPNARYNRTLSGWFDAETFENWFMYIALPYFKTLEGNKIMLGDNLCSHLTVSVVEACQNNNIRFVLLPPNSTDLLQPLDVAYFRPLKNSWRNILENWKLKNRGVLPKTVFPRLLNETINKVGLRSKENTKAGFKACGLVPFNPDQTLKKIALLRNTENAENEVEQTWTDTIVSHLRELRSGGESAPKRGKRISVEAGRSVSVADLINTLVEKDSPQQEEELVEDECPGTSQDLSDISGADNCKGNEEKNFGIGDFLIVKFSTNKRDKFFVAKIVQINEMDNTLTVNCLRRRRNTKKETFFVYPNVQDISDVKNDQIMKNIFVKSSRREQYVFKNLFDYNLE